MKNLLIIFLIVGCFVGCITPTKFTTTAVQAKPADPLLDLEKAVAQTQMALSIAEMQYMLWGWAILRGEQKYSETDEVHMGLRIKELRETVKEMSLEVQKRTEPSKP